MVNRNRVAFGTPATLPLERGLEQPQQGHVGIHVSVVLPSAAEPLVGSAIANQTDHRSHRYRRRVVLSGLVHSRHVDELVPGRSDIALIRRAEDGQPPEAWPNFWLYGGGAHGQSRS